MERNQFWLFFGFALLLGLVGAAYQHANPFFSLATPHFHQTKLDDDGPMYSGTEHMHLRTGFDGESKFERAAGLSAHLPAQNANGESAAKPVVKAVAKKDEKKKDDKKKKKKKDDANQNGLGNVPGTGGAGGDDKEGSQDENADNGAGGGGGASAGGAGSAQGGAGGSVNNGVPVTLADWEKYILTNPDYKRTAFMVQMYQSGVLKADIYFQVLNLMIADPRDQMRALGVMAAGSAPSSASFAILLNEKNSTTETTPNRSQAQSYLRNYMQPQYLKFLMAVLSENSNVQASYTALGLVQLSAQTYLKAAVVATTQQTAAQQAAAAAQAETHAQAQIEAALAAGAYQTREEAEAALRQAYAVRATEQSSFDPRQFAVASATTPTATTTTATTTTATTTTATSAAKLIKYYTPFVSVIASLTKSSTNATVKSAAQQALATLQSLLGTTATTTPAATVATNP